MAEHHSYARDDCGNSDIELAVFVGCFTRGVTIVQAISFMCLVVAAVLAGMSHYFRNMHPTLAAVEAGLAVLNLGLAIRGLILHGMITLFRERL